MSFFPTLSEVRRKNRTNVLLYKSTFVLFFSEKNLPEKKNGRESIFSLCDLKACESLCLTRFDRGLL